jgi:hypothetical protein
MTKKSKNGIPGKLDDYMSTKLIRRLRLYTAIMVIMFLIISYEVVRSNYSIYLAVAGTSIGLVVGIIISREYKLSWDDSAHQVIGQMDRIGGVILIFYLIFMVTRTILIGEWIHGTPLFASVLSITMGTMFSRVITTRISVENILKALKAKQI